MAIAAFSNCVFDYRNYLRYGIRVKVKKNDISHFPNDLLYGILYDPLHVETVFENSCRTGSYKLLCDLIDNMFDDYLEKKEINYEYIKTAMIILSIYSRINLSKMVDTDFISEYDAKLLIDRFNVIFESMKSEYGITFSKEDLAPLRKIFGDSDGDFHR